MITQKCSEDKRELSGVAVCGCEQNDGCFFVFRAVCKEDLHNKLVD